METKEQFCLCAIVVMQLRQLFHAEIFFGIEELTVNVKK